MSGTSLDGLDLADCLYTWIDNQWRFEILNASTEKYSSETLEKLRLGVNLDPNSIQSLDEELALFFALQCQRFDLDSIDFIASHGHTILHQPENGLTLQIADPEIIANKTGKMVVADFRTLDVKLGGQGAPLVPIGDHFLFSEYNYCVNLGGFANVSKTHKDIRIAYDICAVNVVLNHYMRNLGHDYDKGGSFAKSGEIKADILRELNEIEYYSRSNPKSLGMEWVNKNLFPILNKIDSEADIMRTYVEHAGLIIGKELKGSNTNSILTGGGVFNTFLMERIEHYSESKITTPSSKIIDYKEALIFGLLGVLRIREEINTLKSVTGASRDSVGGKIFGSELD